MTTAMRQPRSRPRPSGSGRAAQGQAGSRRAAAPGRSVESAAVGRAYARRAGRHPVEAGGTGAGGRSRFVLLVMALLGGGLVATLWLSTSAAADSYRLDEARRSTRDLSERSETLRTEIAALRSAPALAQAARALGLVPTSDAARLVAGPDGSVVVVGTPKAAVAPPPVLPPPPPMPATPPDPDGQPAPEPAQPGQPNATQQPPARSAASPQQLAAGAGR